jgi:hypothetical protein
MDNIIIELSRKCRFTIIQIGLYHHEMVKDSPKSRTVNFHRLLPKLWKRLRNEPEVDESLIPGEKRFPARRWVVERMLWGGWQNGEASKFAGVNSPKTG